MLINIDTFINRNYMLILLTKDYLKLVYLLRPSKDFKPGSICSYCHRRGNLFLKRYRLKINNQSVTSPNTFVDVTLTPFCSGASVDKVVWEKAVTKDSC